MHELAKSCVWVNGHVYELTFKKLRLVVTSDHIRRVVRIIHANGHHDALGRFSFDETLDNIVDAYYGIHHLHVIDVVENCQLCFQGASDTLGPAFDASPDLPPVDCDAKRTQDGCDEIGYNSQLVKCLRPSLDTEDVESVDDFDDSGLVEQDKLVSATPACRCSKGASELSTDPGTSYYALEASTNAVNLARLRAEEQQSQLEAKERAWKCLGLEVKHGRLLQTKLQLQVRKLEFEKRVIEHVKEYERADMAVTKLQGEIEKADAEVTKAEKAMLLSN